MVSALFAKRKSIIDIIDRHRAAVLAGEEKALREMIRAYGPVDAYLRSKLTEIERLIALAQANGDDPGWRLFEQARYKDLLEQVEARVEKFSTEAERKTEGYQKTSAVRGTKNAAELLKAEVNVRSAFTTLNSAAIETMVGSLSDGSPLRELFGTFGAQARAKASEIMVAGIANGDSPRLTAVRLANEVQGLTRDRAVIIARNESLRTLTLSTQRTYEANADVCQGSRIISALDARTCPMCWARHGTILKHGEPFHRHVCCRCALAPFTTFSRGIATGDEELRNMPEAFQKKVLGDARYELWKKGKISLDDIYKKVNDPKWGPQLQSRSLSQIKKLERKVPLTVPSPSGFNLIAPPADARAFRQPKPSQSASLPGNLSNNADPLTKKLFGTGQRTYIGDVKAVESHMSKLLGKPVTIKDIGDMAGVFDKSKVGFRKLREGVEIKVAHPIISSQKRTLTVKAGVLECHNDIFTLTDSAKKDPNLSGLGARMLAVQVESLTAFGASKIVTHAAGKFGDPTFNGYYTWIRLGFTGNIPKVLLPSLRASTLPDAEKLAVKVESLMFTQEGRDWWKLNGRDIYTAVFKLDANSYSRNTLTGYLASKKVKFDRSNLSKANKSNESKLGEMFYDSEFDEVDKAMGNVAVIPGIRECIEDAVARGDKALEAALRAELEKQLNA